MLVGARQQRFDAPLGQVSVAVIDSSWLVGETLVRALVSNGIQAVQAGVDDHLVGYDVVVADSHLPPVALKVVAARVAALPYGRLVLLSPQVTNATRQVVRESGAVLAVERSAEIHVLVDTLRAMIAGTQVANPCADVAKHGLSSLTRRELEILGLIATGVANDAVGIRLGISPHTVRSHLANIQGKLDVTGRLDAVALVRESALIPPPRRAATVPR
jgi:DNA-binding NarL/FixJ family response regulator